ncbi:MAG TPA: hypothetical protein DEA26_06730 [Oceanospirillales bacterium]|nr:hypothetical protein [Oceanospirillales bacterium]
MKKSPRIMTESGYTAHMCLIVFDWHPGSEQWLTLSANRDEVFYRPTRPLQPWPQHPGLFAGQDLEKGGTWLGLTDKGRWAALTNVRVPGAGPQDPRSRGELVLNYLTSDLAPEAWAEQLDTAEYAPFNLLTGTSDTLCYTTNYPDKASRILAPGRYGLSNAQLNTPWPKVRLALQQLAAAPAPEALTTLLSHREPFADNELPHTGVSELWERLLSAQFIRAPGYGTRCSTGLSIRGHLARLEEITWNEEGEAAGQALFTIPLTF